MNLGELKNNLDKLNVQAEWVGLRHYSNQTRYIAIRDDKPQTNYRYHSDGIMVEAFSDGCFAYSGTSDVTFGGIQRALDSAQQKAKALAKYNIFKFSLEQRPKAVGEYVSPSIKEWDSLTQAEVNDRMIRVCASMKVSDKIVSRQTGADYTVFENLYVCTNGSQFAQKLFYTGSNVYVAAEEGTQVQMRSDAGFRGSIFQLGFESFEEEALLKKASSVTKDVLDLLKAENCPNETMDLVLSPDQMMLQIHECIGHPIELDRILGDERNYAGSSFVKLKDFGHLQYGSPLLNVTFDPTIEHQLASYGFDDSGAPAKKEFLIKDGVLVRGLGGLESQARSGLPGVANFRANSWNRAPIDRMANINVEPGHSSVDDIISSVEKGVYMESNKSWSIDDYRNKFQFGCEFARLIENGKLTKVVRNPNYRGVSASFWKSLDKVGNSDSFAAFGTPNCGKGEPNQGIWVGHASPVCKFKNVEVFGE